MLCNFWSERAALILLALTSRVMKAMVRPSCRLLSAPGRTTTASLGIIRVMPAIPVKWVANMPPAINRLAAYLSNR
ncbi:hypothetical protein D9M71_488130 [compost metagenome]